MTVVSDPNLPEGTTRWTVAPTPAPNTVWFEGPIYTHRIDASVPDFFMVETNTSTFERTLRAVSESGEVDWIAASPGVPLMGDSFGGVIAGVEPAPNHCLGPFNQIQRCYTALARFAGPAGTASWRYDSPGLVDRPAQGPDGTVYVVEHLGNHLYQPNDNGNATVPGQKVLVILDGATGAVTARVPLEGNVNHEPVTIGPIVGSDGYGYVLSTKGLQITLHQVSRDGEVASAVIVPATCSGQCRQPEPRQLLPDGLGGLLVVADWGKAGLVTTDLRLTRFDSDGNRTDTTLAGDTGRIELIGQGGSAYLRRTTSGSISGTTVSQTVMNIPTWTTRWNLPVEWKLLAAAPDGGAVAENAAGDIAHFDGTGQLLRTVPAVGLRNPVQEAGGWIGASGLAPNTPLGLRKIEGTVEDATYFSVRYAPQLWTGTEQYGFGNPPRNLAARSPEVLVTVNVFIPAPWVDNPNPFTGTVFEGDDRTWSRTGSSRIHQQVQLSLTSTRNAVTIGTTREFHKQSSLDANGNITLAARNDTVVGDAYLKVAEATASPSGVTVTRQVSGTVATIRLSGSAGNPLLPSPTIDYQIDVSIDFSDPLNLRYTVVGEHDGFPNYELYLNEEHIHGYSHGSETPLSLPSPMEKHFQRSGRVQQ